MNNVSEGFRLLGVVVVGLIALAGLALIHHWFRFVIFLAGVLIVLYLLGALPDALQP